MGKSYLFTAVGGLLIGWILATWFAPGAISWYFDPPVQIGVNCKDATVWAMERFRGVQIAAMIAGILIGCTGVFIVNKKFGKAVTATKE